MSDGTSLKAHRGAPKHRAVCTASARSRAGVMFDNRTATAAFTSWVGGDRRAEIKHLHARMLVEDSNLRQHASVTTQADASSTNNPVPLGLKVWDFSPAAMRQLSGGY